MRWILAALLGLAGVQAAEGAPGEREQLLALIPAAWWTLPASVAPEDDGGLAFKAAVEALTPPYEQSELHDALTRCRGRGGDDEGPTPADWAAASGWMRQHRAQAQALHAALARPAVRPGSFSLWKDGLRALELEAALAVHEWRWQDAYRSVDAMALMVRHYEAEQQCAQTKTSQLMASMPMSLWAIQMSWQLRIACRDPDAERLSLRLAQVRAWRPPTVESRRGMLMRGAIDELMECPTDGAGWCRLMKSAFTGIAESTQPGVPALAGEVEALLRRQEQVLDRLATVRLFRARLEETATADASTATPDERDDADVGELLGRTSILVRDGEDRNAQRQLLAMQRSLSRDANAMGRAWLAVGENCRPLFARMEGSQRAQVALLQAALALTVAHRRQQAWPESFAAVVASGLLPVVPVDPWDGKSLRYDPARRLVWSVGDDGVDDGGDPLSDTVVELSLPP